MAEQDFLNYASDDGGNVSVPRRLKTRRNAPDVELAYITPEEAGILSTLRPGSPHRGPMEVPSYDAFDASGSYRSGAEMSAAETGGTGHGMTGDQAAGYRQAAITAGAPKTKQDEINAFNRAQWNQRFKPYNKRNTPQQSGQGFFSSLFGGGIRNLISGLGDKLRTVDGQIMPQSYFSEEEREKRRALRSINTIMNRKAPVTNLTNKRLGQLYDTLRTPSGQRNLFTDQDIGRSPEMLQANELGLYNERITPGNAGVQVGAEQIDEAPINNRVNLNDFEGVTFNEGPNEQINYEEFVSNNPEIRGMMPQIIENYKRQNEVLPVNAQFTGNLEDYQRGMVKNVGMNQDQIDYLNKIDTLNKAVGNTGYSTYAKSERYPNQMAGAFFEHQKPEDVWNMVESLNPKSTDWYSSAVNPEKIVEGDTSTFAQPDEVTSYLKSLSPQDPTYSYGLRKNVPGVDYSILPEVATGGFIRKGYNKGGRVGILSVF